MSSTSAINITNPVLDVFTIVDNLIKIDSAPVTNMQSQVSSLQSRVSAYQSLNTKLSALSNAANTMLFGTTEAPLIQPYSYADRLADSIFAKCSVTSTNDSIISATASNAISGGNYSIQVTGLAQAESMASSGFADATSAQTGTGTITIATGSSAPVTITINSTNSTLRGVRDAINNANAGVTATIVNSGSSSNPYQLLIRANNTGTANSFTVTSSLSGGQALSFAQTQQAKDAQFSMNGVNITKSSNTVSDIIDGVTLTLKAKTDGPVIVSVAKDFDSIASALQNCVTAYNAVNSFISSQFTYNTTTKTAGVLAGDTTLRNVQSLLRNPFNQSVSNRYTNYRAASQIGLEFDRDGNLTLDASKFQDALTNNFTAVAALFLGDGTAAGGATASDSRVTCAGQTSATQSGSYSVQVDSLAQQASVVGGQTLTTLSADETLTITSGTASAVVPLLAGDSISTVLSKINSALSNQNMAVNASDDGTGKIEITTNGYGSAQNITVVSDGDGSAGTTGFGTSPISATGTDITGEINGDPAIGNGLTLTGAAGQPEEGLSLNIAQSTTGDYGTVTVAPATDGVEGSSILTSLFSALQALTDPLSNLLQSATDGINQNITALKKSISSYQDRLETERQMLTDEFNRADEALRLLSVNQAQLSSQLATLLSSSSK